MKKEESLKERALLLGGGGAAGKRVADWNSCCIDRCWSRLNGSRLLVGTSAESINSAQVTCMPASQFYQAILFTDTHQVRNAREKNKIITSRNPPESHLKNSE